MVKKITTYQTTSNANHRSRTSVAITAHALPWQSPLSRVFTLMRSWQTPLTHIRVLRGIRPSLAKKKAAGFEACGFLYSEKVT